MTDQKDINPVYVDGEPMCGGEQCLAFQRGSTCDVCTCYGKGSWDGTMCVDANALDDCVPALRRDRDLALKDVRDLEEDDVVVHLCAAEEEIERLRTRKDDPACVERVAKALRNWSEAYTEPGEWYTRLACNVLAAADAEE